MTITRYYLQNASAPYVPSVTGSWDDAGLSGSIYSEKLDTTKSGSLAVQSRAETTGTPLGVLLHTFISDALANDAAIDFSDGAIGIIEHSTSADFVARIHIWVTQGDSSTPRGTIVDNWYPALSGNELSTAALTGGKSLAAATSSAVTAVAGDRIVVELGYHSYNTRTNSYTGTLYYGGTSASDIAAGGTSGDTGWIDFDITQSHFDLTTQSTAHLHAVGSVELQDVPDYQTWFVSQSYIEPQLTVASTTHAHSAQNLADVTGTYVIVAQDAVIAHSASAVEVTQFSGTTQTWYVELQVAGSEAAADDAVVAHSVESIDIAQHVVYDVEAIPRVTLDAGDTVHLHATDNVELVLGESVVPRSTIHLHTVGRITLGVDRNLTVRDTIHLHAVDEASATEVTDYTLIVGDTMHAHAVDDIDLAVLRELTLADCIHAHAAGAIDLVSPTPIALTSQDTTHLHSVGNVAISQMHILTLHDTVHAHAVGRVRLPGAESYNAPIAGKGAGQGASTGRGKTTPATAGRGTGYA